MKTSQLFIAIFAFVALVSLIPSTYAASHSDSLGDAWNSIKTSLENAEKAETIEDALTHHQTAVTTYDDHFKTVATELDPESDQLIQTAFSDIEELLQAGDISQAKLERQIVDKTIYKIAFLKIEQAFENDDAQQFLDWYTVMESKFAISEKSSFETNNAVIKIQSDPNELKEYSEIITNELLGIFKLKTIEEIEEAVGALDAGNISDAKKFTYEGLYYYRTLHPSVETKLGSDVASKLLDEMKEAIEVVESDLSVAEMKSEMEHILSEVELIIREYEGGDTSDIGLALSGIKDRLVLVDEEYAAAVANGVIVDQVEYDETVVFLNKAFEIYNSNQAALSALSESESSNLLDSLKEIEMLVTSFGPPSQVSTNVDKALSSVASLQELSGGAVETDVFGYIDTIEELLNQAKTEYRNGNAQLAHDLVTTAYLDNYEFVEGPLGEVDRELMEKIEIDMREELRSMIKSNVPADQIDQQVDMILEDLEVARTVVPEFGSIAAMILAVAIVSIIAVTARSKLNLTARI